LLDTFLVFVAARILRSWANTILNSKTPSRQDGLRAFDAAIAEARRVVSAPDFWNF
jgi:hypothetical protein